MLKALRTIALFLCVIFVSSILYQAKAEGAATVSEPVPYTLEQCTSELSQCTSYKYYKNENTERYINYRLLHTGYTLDAIISYVNIGLDQPFYSNPVETENPASTSVLVNKYRPLPSDFVPSRLETINGIYTYGTQKLTHYARLAFEKLCAAAKVYGYPIFATSAYRSYSRQAEVYASFYNPDDPSSAIVQDLLAAQPGYSEHQTGLAVDYSRVNPLDSSADVQKWMAKNSYKYGFIIRYPNEKEGVTGYANEPWHLRYLGVKLATAVYNSRYTYDEYYAREIDVPAINSDITAIGITAVSDITVGGNPYQLSAYRVLGDTYYKLRDIAIILNDTAGAFDVSWNAEASRIDLLPGSPYSSDLTLGAFEADHIVLVSASKPGLLFNDTAYDLSAYIIDGSNYFKLYDIMNILGTTVTYGETGNVIIDTVSTPVIPPAETPVPIT